MFAVIWGLAGAGVLLKSLSRVHPVISSAIYVGMGWLALAAGEPLLADLPRAGLGWLLAGGIAYTYQDQAMDPAVGHAIASATDPVAAFAADRTLWGDWASDARLVSALRTAFARVQTFVSEHQT
jgi:D-arabinitol 4-dehydrogenase